MRQSSQATVFLVVLSTVCISAQQGRARLDAVNESAARANGAPAPPIGPAPRLADGKPDLSGVWFGGGPFGTIEDGLPAGEAVPLLAEARKLKESRLAKDDPVVNCLPAGVPRAMLLPWRIVQTATHIFFLVEGDSYRQIFMDGRSHPATEALNPSWYGHSIGHWDGDTLVVDTVGFNDRTWFDYVGHPHTERLHVVERWMRPEFGTLENQVTIDDPGAYARPFTATFRARLLPGIDLMEYICNENNKALSSIRGLAEDNRPNPSR
jgi:hypothetical protein